MQLVLEENYQRNCIHRGLESAKDNDLIIISDLDEIPNPKVINNFKENMLSDIQSYYYKNFEVFHKIIANLKVIY